MLWIEHTTDDTTVFFQSFDVSAKTIPQPVEILDESTFQPPLHLASAGRGLYARGRSYHGLRPAPLPARLPFAGLFEMGRSGVA